MQKTTHEYLIALGSDLDIQDLMGQTALILAVQNGRPECVKALANSGADINIQDAQEMTAFMYAKEMCQYQYLVKLKHTKLVFNSLKHQCRMAIRAFLRESRSRNIYKQILQLGLPYLLNEYLMFDKSPEEDVDDTDGE